MLCAGVVSANSLPATRQPRALAPAPAAAGLQTLAQPPARAARPAAGAAAAPGAPALNGAAFGVGW